MMSRWKRRVFPIWLVVVAVLLPIYVWQAKRNLPSNPVLAIACDGGLREQQYLAQQVDTVVERGQRRILSGQGLVVYRIPIGRSEPHRLSLVCNRTLQRVEFSPDGQQWSTLFSIGSRDREDEQEFRPSSCGFGPEQRRQAAKAGAAWVRMRAYEESQRTCPAVRSIALEVMGPDVPAGFVVASPWSLLARLLPVRLLILVGVGAVLLCRWRWKTAWYLFGLGALLWITSVGMKFGFAWLTLGAVWKALAAVLPAGPAAVAFWGYSGLLTGIFECGIFLVIVGYIRRKKWSWREAASVGVGFGAVEAVVLGIVAAAVAGAADPASPAPPVNLWLAGAVERVIALFVHVSATTMIVHAINRGRWGWFVTAFFYKSAVDGVAVPFASGMAAEAWREAHPWTFEFGCMGPFAAAGIILLLVLRRRWAAPAVQSREPQPVPTDA